MKQMKHNGREPASAMRVVTELFNRGDIVRADALKAPTKQSAAQSSYSLGTIRSTLSGYIWGSAKATGPSLDDPIVPVAALQAAAQRASSLSGPMASSDIHTVKTFAAAITADSTRDAEAVIAHIVAKGEAAVLFTDVTKENPEAILGVKLGKGKAAESDKGVLHTKAALERMEEMAQHLEVAVSVERSAATAAAKSGAKGEALTRLRKMKMVEAKLASARSAGAKLSDVLMAVDEAESNREAVTALETGMASLKVATKDGVTAERVDAVAADYDEMMGEQQDMRVAFEQLNVDVTGSDAALEAELEDMMAQEAQGDAAGAAAQAEGAEGDTDKSKLDEEAEAELAKLLAELPTPTAYEGKGGATAAEADELADEAQGERAAEKVAGAV